MILNRKFRPRAAAFGSAFALSMSVWTPAYSQEVPTYYKIQAVHSGLYLDVQGQSINNQANVVQWQDHQHLNQRWILARVPGQGQATLYWIIAAHSGLLLDVLNQSIYNEGNVGQWQKTGLKNQVWSFENGTHGGLRIRNLNSSLYLDVLGQNMHNAGNVAQWQHTGLANQEWRLVPAGAVPMPAAQRIQNQPADPPQLRSHSRPQPSEARVIGQMFLPSIQVDDPGRSEQWKVLNSPFYSLERHLRFVPVFFKYNNTSQNQPEKWIETRGWEKTESESFSITTGISVSSGIGPATAEASVELGYSRESSFTESYTQGTEKDINVGPNTSVAVWVEESNIILRRVDGSVVRQWVRNGDWYLSELKTN